jgi:hypothetical protein
MPRATHSDSLNDSAGEVTHRRSGIRSGRPSTARTSPSAFRARSSTSAANKAGGTAWNIAERASVAADTFRATVAAIRTCDRVRKPCIGRFARTDARKYSEDTNTPRSSSSGNADPPGFPNTPTATDRTEA